MSKTKTEFNKTGRIQQRKLMAKHKIENFGI
uniref:Uncharacterized protein n=1 Tax=Anopheles dirus TaxID=7168 RepID=A0A182NWT0_9DIPT